MIQLPNIFPEIPNVDTNAVIITETQGSSCRNLFFHAMPETLLIMSVPSGDIDLTV